MAIKVLSISAVNLVILKTDSGKSFLVPPNLQGSKRSDQNVSPQVEFLLKNQKGVSNVFANDVIGLFKLVDCRLWKMLLQLSDLLWLADNLNSLSL